MIIPMIAAWDDASMGGAIWDTPGQQRDAEEEINTAVVSLDSDIGSSSVVGQDFVTAWQSFKAGWDAFYSGQGGITGWLDRFASSSMSQINDYRTQLTAWQSKFQALGGAVSGPGLVPPPADTTSDTVKYIAITAGILGALWVASTVYKEVRGRAPAVTT